MSELEGRYPGLLDALMKSYNALPVEGWKPGWYWVKKARFEGVIKINSEAEAIIQHLNGFDIGKFLGERYET